MKFENQICPVCENKFTENDEIVVCPECGTPHHRECYFSLGECKNKVLHNENFSYKPVEVKTEGIDVLIEDDVKKTEEILDVVNVEFNSEDSKNNEALNNTIEELFKNINGKTTDQVLINNTPSSFYESAVGKNQNYYMPRFLIMEGTNKKQFLNVFAFIFPLAWSVYRKMYKLALLVFCIYIALMGITVAPLMTNEEIMTSMEQCVSEDPNCMENILLYQSGQSVKLTKNQAQLVKLLNDFKISPIIVYGTFAVSICMKIFMGLSATKLYKEKLEKNIKRVMKLPLDDAQRKTYLKSKYGVTPMFVAVIIGFIEYTFLGRF
ncbi:MAG: DUF2628 domain-containing protein [Ruminococcaceae bacterium]|nr:DUF2628 domain-containing protein [Oscillospiraceae bacterium]